VHTLSEKIDDDMLLFQSADGMSVIHSMLGNYLDSLRHGREAVRLARGMDDLQAQTTSLGNLAMTFTAIGRLRRSLKLFLRANRIAERIGDIHKFAVSFFNLGNVLDGLGRLHQATGPYLRCIELAEKVGDRVLETVGKLCFAWHHLLLWDIPEARRIVRDLREPVQNLGNRFCTAMLLETEARLHHHRGELQRAEAGIEEALRIYEDLDYSERIVDCRLLQGRILGELGRLDRAKAGLNETAGFASEKRMAGYEAEAHHLLGIVALASGNRPEAEGHLEKARAQFRKLGCMVFSARPALRLASLHASRGRTDQAKEILREVEEVARKSESEELAAEARFVSAQCSSRDAGGARRASLLKALDTAADRAERAEWADLVLRANEMRGRVHGEGGNTAEASSAFRRVREIFDRMTKNLDAAQVEVFTQNPLRAPIWRSLREFEERGEGRRDAPSPAAKPAESVPSPGEMDPGGPVPPHSLEAVAQLVDRAGTEKEKNDFEALRAGVSDLGELQAVIMRLSAEHNIDAALSQVLDAAIDFTHAQRGFFILNDQWVDEASFGPMNFVATRNFDREDVRSPESKISRSIALEVGRTGKPIVIHEAALDPRFGQAGSVFDLSLRSVACIPLLEGGRSIGVMYLDNRFKSGAFAEEKIVLLLTLAQQAAQSIGRARLYRGVLDERKRVEKLNTRLQELNRELQEKVHTQLMEIGEIRESLEAKERDLGLRFRYEEIIGKSPAMQQIFRLLDRIIDTDLPVLITGPTGSGKDLIAKTIHYQSGRKKGNLVTENCAALPETLLESELFGFVKGAFTDAREDKKGLLEQADEGTLFLDEIGEMSPGMQAKLLRALERKEIRRVGGKETLTLDIRIIAATNRDLGRAVREGTFREDLYFRLNAFTLKLPPLKKRPEDIPLLVDHFLGPYAKLKGIEKPVIPPRVMEVFLHYAWPGNIRELRNEIERLVALSESGAVSMQDLSPHLVRTARTRALKSIPKDVETRFDAAVARFEIEFLRAALDQNKWNVVQTAKQLGINRMKLARKIKKYGLSRDIP
jgi:transcriptional regulator with GAF, ATPase, and Fis domain